MTIHANGKLNSGLLATGQLGDAVKRELKGLNLQRNVEEVVLSNDQVRILLDRLRSPSFSIESPNMFPDDDFRAFSRLCIPHVCLYTGAR
jgi:hypothetical protein